MENTQGEKLSKKTVIIISAIVAVLVCAIAVFIIIDQSRLTAVNIRLQRLVGTVNLYDDKGKEKELVEKMRLNSGQSLTTADESLVMMSLDETKLLTLEESSKAAVKAARRGKELEFDLIEGNLFFNVNEKLPEDESFEIDTTNMSCGIRGTSAYVGKDASYHDTLMVTDGTIGVDAENPVTHEVIHEDVSAGEMITIFLDDEAAGDKTISIEKKQFREEDLPALALDAIHKDKKLQERIAKATGFSAEKLNALTTVCTIQGVSMYGSAAQSLDDAGIEDAIPYMGGSREPWYMPQTVRLM